MRDLRGGFQFTHPCGCDGQAVRNIPIPVRFNSRTRVGATARKAFNVPDAEVSIHAPVWVRRATPRNNKTIERFQFTHPCGCDRHPVSPHVPHTRFNSRTRVGATLSGDSDSTTFKVSIHAPVWVRLVNMLERRDFSGVSIHAPVWVRLRKATCPHDNGLFQFTHPCGCDGATRKQ